MPIGERIKERREECNLTQAKLGEMAGTDSTSVSRWETNKTKPSQKYLGKIANALCTSIDYLLNETDDPAPQIIHVQNVPPAERSVVEKNHGTLMYMFKDGDKVELPDTDKGYALFREILAQKAVMA